VPIYAIMFVDRLQAERPKTARWTETMWLDTDAAERWRLAIVACSACSRWLPIPLLLLSSVVEAKCLDAE
jgi:hypothetical protein